MASGERAGCTPEGGTVIGQAGGPLALESLARKSAATPALWQRAPASLPLSGRNVSPAGKRFPPGRTPAPLPAAARGAACLLPETLPDSPSPAPAGRPGRYHALSGGQRLS